MPRFIAYGGIILGNSFSPAGRRWPEGPDEGAFRFEFMDFRARGGYPLTRLTAPSPRWGEGVCGSVPAPYAIAWDT